MLTLDLETIDDCLSLPLEDDSVDFCLTSPPYEDARLYGKLKCKLRGQDWVDWAIARYEEQLRVTKGIVAWVVEGRTRQFNWSATPMRLAIALQDAGYYMRKPPLYIRWGIPGSGGRDFFRNRYEFILCFTKNRRALEWSDNTACGRTPKYKPGGAPTHHGTNGRVDVERPIKVARTNPGNLVEVNEPFDDMCIDCGAGGGGHMGSPHAHRNEAPFPELLADRMIRSFCKPNGVVLDPMCGSGTTIATALKLDRSAIGYDARPSQIRIVKERCAEIVDYE